MANRIYDQYKITAAGRSTQMIIEASSYTTTPSNSPPLNPQSNNAEKQVEFSVNAKESESYKVHLDTNEFLKVKQPEPNQIPYFWLNGQGHCRSIPSFNIQSRQTVPDKNKQTESQSETGVKEIGKETGTEAFHASRTSLCNDTNQDTKFE